MAAGLEAIRAPGALPGRRQLAQALTFLACVAALGAGAAAGGRLGVVCGSLLVMAVAGPTVWRLRRDPLDAPGIYALASAVTLGAFSLLWLGTPYLPAPGIGPTDVSRALLIVSVGLASFGVAARLTGRARRRAPLEFPASEAPPPGLIVGLFAIGAVGLVTGLALGALGYNSRTAPGSSLLASAQLFTQVAAAGTFAVVICALSTFGADRRRYARLLAVLLGLQVLGGFAAGYKSQSILPAVLVILCYVTCKLRVPWRTLAIGAVATALVLAPANFIYRQYLRPNPNTGAPSRPFGKSVTAGASFFLSTRLRLIDDVALIDARTPSVYPYAGGQRYLYLPALILVPRALWPAKPVLDAGLEFSHTYWQFPSTSRSLTPLTQVGDLLRNFAVGGVIAGMGIWGLVLGLSTVVCHRRRRSPRVQMVYLVALATTVLFVETNLPELVAGAAKSLPVAAVVAWMLLPGSGAPAGYRRVLAWLGGGSGAARDRPAQGA